MQKHTILFLASNPSGTEWFGLDQDARRVAFDEEANAIRKELKRSGHRDRFDLVTRWAAEPHDLLRELRELKPTVVHFSGHGRQDGLFFQSPTGDARLVSPAAVVETFGVAGASVRLVVLSACYSEVTAAALIVHVDCVVGMSGLLPDNMAKAFASGFYGALGDQESVRAAYQHGNAAISLEGLSESNCPQLRVRSGIDAAQLVLTADVPAEPPTANSVSDQGVFASDVVLVSSSSHPAPPLRRSTTLVQAQTRTQRLIDPASALISNTMVCEVSRLMATPADAIVDGPSMRGPADVRVIQTLDLFSLIEAVVLHEKLYTLPARQASGVSGLQLRAALIDAGVVCELDTTGEHDKIANVLLERLTSLTDPVTSAGSGVDITRLRYELEGCLHLEEPEGLYLDRGLEISVPDTFDRFARRLVLAIRHLYSGSYEESKSILRDLYYIFAAEYFGLPYWPHFSRIKLSRSFPNFFDAATRLRLYGRVAEAFKSSVEEVFEDTDEQIVLIPPFATLVLDRCNSAADLVREILAVREEYAPLRAGFARLEEERRSAATLKERIRIRHQQKLLLEDLARRFENPAKVNLEGVVRVVPDLAESGTQPMSPSIHAAKLATMPLESIARWWRRRPISKLFELKSRLERVRSYEHLVHKVVGEDIDLRARLAQMSPTIPPSEFQQRRLYRGQGSWALVIDDDPRRALLLKGFLMSLIDRVLIANDIDGALAIARTEHPTLAVVSGWMSRTDELISILEHDPDTAKTRVMVVGDAERHAHFVAAGADCVVAFPIQPAMFRAACLRIIALDRSGSGHR